MVDARRRVKTSSGRKSDSSRVSYAAVDGNGWFASDEGTESLHHRGAVESIERNVAAAAGARPVRHHRAVTAFGKEICPSAPAIGGTLIAGAGVSAAVNHDDGRVVGRGRRRKGLEINRHRRSDQTGRMDHGHDGNSTAKPRALRADTLGDHARTRGALTHARDRSVGKRVLE